MVVPTEYTRTKYVLPIVKPLVVIVAVPFAADAAEHEIADPPAQVALRISAAGWKPAVPVTVIVGLEDKAVKVYHTSSSEEPAIAGEHDPLPVSD